MDTGISARTVRVVAIVAVAGALAVALSLAISTYSLARVLSAPQASSPPSVPDVVGFEGFLADSGGDPFSDAAYTMTFRVYDAAAAGTSKWTETHTAVTVTSGYYAVELGGSTAFGTDTFSGTRWIGITVEGDSEMAPRTKVSSVPFALNAGAVDGLHAAESGSDAHVLATDSDGDATVSGGLNVGTASGAEAGDLALSGSITESTPLGCRVRRTTSQAISHQTKTAVSFNSELHDTDSCWSAGVPTRLTARTAGYYLAGGNVYFQANSTGSRTAQIDKNDVTNLAYTRLDNAGSDVWKLSISTGMFWMDAGDFIRVWVYQNSGGSLNLVGDASHDYLSGWLVRIP